MSQPSELLQDRVIEAAPSSVSRSTTAHNLSIVVDLIVAICSTKLPSPCDLSQRKWTCVEKDLYLQTSPDQNALLYVITAPKAEVAPENLVIADVKISLLPPSAWDTGASWESGPGGIWLLRRPFHDCVDTAVTEVDVLFGEDAVDPRPHWTLLDSPLYLSYPPKAPVAQLSIRRGRSKTIPDAKPVLRANACGKFRIIQISDTHMVTGVGVCDDAIDAHGNHLPESDADPLTVDFIEKILDLEKPELVVLTGDQVHHDVLDTRSALFKVTAPIIERGIPFAPVFGNHDSTAQIAILESLPFSLSESGPAGVDGVGNFHLQILASVPSEHALATLYFLDSHAQIPSKTSDPDYKPIQQSQVDWFVNTSRTLRHERQRNEAENRSHLSLVFMHIPVPEFGDALLNICTGARREPTEGPSVNTQFYDALVKENVSALACGHDHVNDFCALLPTRINDHVARLGGPWLCYGGTCGFGGYCSYGGKRYHRRARVWELNTTTGDLKTWLRVEYGSERPDEVTLVREGHVVVPGTLGY